MWMMLLLFALGNAIAQDRPQADPYACTGPSASVIVMALQDPVNGDAHMLVVKNDSRDSVMSLMVGMGLESELRVSDFAIPRQIMGPPGWNARHIVEENNESAKGLFMRWLWAANTIKDAIAPGELVSGFRVILPPFPARLRGQYYDSGASPVIPIKVSDLPFQVRLSGGGCVWGRIRPLVLGSPTK
jgi:hypothetical protein